MELHAQHVQMVILMSVVHAQIVLLQTVKLAQLSVLAQQQWLQLIWQVQPHAHCAPLLEKRIV